MKKIIIGYIIAAILWFLMFSPWTSGYINFWGLMLFSTGGLTAYSFLAAPKNELRKLYSVNFKYVIIGIVSAIALYIFFYIGNEISQLLFNFSKNQVAEVYRTKEQAGKIFIGLALLFWIGPAEEIFWRGFAQKRLADKVGDYKALIITSLVYASVHIWSGNIMLLITALICGLFWGWMFLKYKSLVPALISHAIWDVLIFVIIPLS